MTTIGTPGTRFESPRAVNDALSSVGYLADEGIAAVVFLADRLGKPVLVEGPAGTGKTQLAKSVSEMTGARLIRLQCYEGLDESKALYEWNYKKQLLRIQAEQVTQEGETWQELEEDIFSEPFLMPTAAAGGHPVDRAGRPADRRGGPGRSRNRGPSPGGAVRLPGLGTRDGHGQRHPDPFGFPDFQQHP